MQKLLVTIEIFFLKYNIISFILSNWPIVLGMCNTGLYQQVALKSLEVHIEACCLSRVVVV